MSLTTSSPRVNFVTALPSEAAPLVEHYQLARRARYGRLTVYSRDNIQLAVAGIGKTAVATAVGVLGATTTDLPTAFINVGIAGHAGAALGSCFLVDKIVDDASQQTAYPPIAYPNKLPSSPLCTVATPQTNYRDGWLYDMEGSAFFDAAKQFTTLECICLIKVISDNRHSPIAKITKNKITELMKDAVANVNEVTSSLASLIETHLTPSRTTLPPDQLPWRVTATQSIQLNRLASRLCVLSPETDLMAFIEDCGTAKQAISKLSETLASLALDFSASQ